MVRIKTALLGHGETAGAKAACSSIGKLTCIGRGAKFGGKTACLALKKLQAK